MHPYKKEMLGKQRAEIGRMTADYPKGHNIEESFRNENHEGDSDRLREAQSLPKFYKDKMPGKMARAKYGEI